MSQDSESQPTPPPRKKRLKKKLEEVLTKEMECMALGGSKPAISINDNPDGCGQMAEEMNEKVEVTINQEQSLSIVDTSPKKARRRKKHAG